MLSPPARSGHKNGAPGPELQILCAWGQGEDEGPKAAIGRSQGLTVHTRVPHSGLNGTCPSRNGSYVAVIMNPHDDTQLCDAQTSLSPRRLPG